MKVPAIIMENPLIEEVKTQNKASAPVQEHLTTLLFTQSYYVGVLESELVAVLSSGKVERLTCDVEINHVNWRGIQVDQDKYF